MQILSEKKAGQILVYPTEIVTALKDKLFDIIKTKGPGVIQALPGFLGRMGSTVFSPGTVRTSGAPGSTRKASRPFRP